MKLNGIVVSEGIGIGNVFFYRAYKPKIIHEMVSSQDIDLALKDIDVALFKSKEELNVLLSNVKTPTQKDILNAHIEILSDPVVFQDIVTYIKTCIHPSKAVFLAYQTYIDLLSQSNNTYMKSRIDDMQDVKMRVLKHLDFLKSDEMLKLKEPTIIVCEDMPPSVLSSLNTHYLTGLITFTGTKDSHTSILAKELGVACMVGIHDIDVNDVVGHEAILDTYKKELMTSINEDIKETYNALIKQNIDIQKQHDAYIHLDPKTQDGLRIDISLNVNTTTEDLSQFTKDVSGIGLLRSEFLYMNQTFIPSVETQTKLYEDMLHVMEGKPVILRTLDIGGDKVLPYYHIDKESNPELGLRGIRRTLLDKNLLYPQIKAALLANQGQLKLMFPMISTVEEILTLKAYVSEVKKELEVSGFNVLPIHIGIMIETPAAAFMMKDIIKHIDFASIGTNDLTQYILAVDRTNAHLNDYYKPYHPAILHVLKLISDAFVGSNKDVSMCGELAGDPRITKVLIGFGFRHLSMSKYQIGAVKKIISNTTVNACENIAHQVLLCETEACVLQVINA